MIKPKVYLRVRVSLIRKIRIQIETFIRQIVGKSKICVIQVNMLIIL